MTGPGYVSQANRRRWSVALNTFVLRADVPPEALHSLISSHRSHGSVHDAMLGITDRHHGAPQPPLVLVFIPPHLDD